MQQLLLAFAEQRQQESAERYGADAPSLWLAAAVLSWLPASCLLARPLGGHLRAPLPAPPNPIHFDRPLHGARGG